PITASSPYLVFIFPSSSPHTSFSRDWSSDVCSSDLSRQLADDRAQRAPPGDDEARHRRPRPEHARDGGRPGAARPERAPLPVPRSEERRVGNERRFHRLPPPCKESSVVRIAVSHERH